MTVARDGFRHLPAGGRPVTLVWVKRCGAAWRPLFRADAVGDVAGDPGPCEPDRAGPAGGVPAVTDMLLDV
jgi:hypothetical protein